MLATYHQNQDLMDVGAYVAGSNQDNARFEIQHACACLQLRLEREPMQFLAGLGRRVGQATREQITDRQAYGAHNVVDAASCETMHQEPAIIAGRYAQACRSILVGRAPRGVAPAMRPHPFQPR